MSEHTTIEIPAELPVLALRDLVVFPFMIAPIRVGRTKSIRAIEESLGHGRLIFLLTQKDPSVEEPEADDLPVVGCIAMVMRMHRVGDGGMKVLVQGLMKARRVEVKSHEPCMRVSFEEIEDIEPPELSDECQKVIESVRDKLDTLAGDLQGPGSDTIMVLKGVQDPGRLADLTAAHLSLDSSEAQEILEVIDPVERLNRVHRLLELQLQRRQTKDRIEQATRSQMSRNQREYYLREQMRQIRRELGDSDEDDPIQELRDRIDMLELPEEALAEVLKQLRRLEGLNAESTEAANLRSYLDWICDLPWNETTEDKLDLKESEAILDSDHYGLNDVKERILEYLSVRQKNPELKGPILCLVGPPGVGKTSIGKSVARALGRRFERISLGGMRDEAEIRGHRRTYVGAMPGRIIQAIKQAGTMNPVIMLDELDKVGSDFRGDPAAALLEVLDPEQNTSFRDHYINLPFDLSQVLFLANANLTDTIPRPLLDRLEMIRLAGYTANEKLQICRRYIVERQREQNGLSDEEIHFSNPALKALIQGYTREAGVRGLERQVGTVCRKVARRIVAEEITRGTITPKALSRYLGPARYKSDPDLAEDDIGCANGLAWTSVGGEVLVVEASLMKGKGNLILTGQLGDVMKESVRAALTFLRSHGDEFGVADDALEEKDLHIHVPAGAIPKDGPSAGITMATAILSLLTERPVKRDVAMTGEITLRGRVMTIGGLKEKCLAALRLGIKTVLIPKGNEVDIAELPKEVRRGLNIYPCEHIREVFEHTFAAREEAPQE
ncbi:MAG: endopeptidase La [Myxococcota bacterium]|nr:endopeptidase La [Myxococcota bacterium]